MLPRQTGKTTCAEFICYGMQCLIRRLFNCPTQIYRCSKKLCNVLGMHMNYAPDHIRAGVTNYNKGPIEFENGSRIVSATTTGNTGRGMSISLLYCDEFAFVQSM